MKNNLLVCFIEVGRVYLRAQLKNCMNPLGEAADADSNGFCAFKAVRGEALAKLWGYVLIGTGQLQVRRK